MVNWSILWGAKKEKQVRWRDLTQPEVQLFLSHYFTASHFASKQFRFYEVLFMEIWAVTKHTLSTFQS